MDRRLINILLDSGFSLITGMFLLYLGFLSPTFRRSSERLAPDRWLGTFRVIVRIAGLVLCLFAGLRIYVDIRQADAVQTLPWREFTSQKGRFHVSAPANFVEEVRDVPYGEHPVKECRFEAVVAPLGFNISYIDLPERMQKTEPNEILNTELEGHLKAAPVELLNRESIRFAGYPAIRFKLHGVSRGIFVEGILLLAKQRRYQLAVQYISESSAPNREQFFNSFQVLDEP